MPHRFIPHQELPLLCRALAEQGELHGPTEAGGLARFRRLERPQQLMLHYDSSRLPPKQYLLPPRETVLTYTPAAGYHPPSAEQSPLILMGLHLCDLAGIAYLDRIFLQPDPDPSYAARRQRLILGGVSCQPHDGCFCSPAGPAPTADFFLIPVDGGYGLTAHSAAGARILEEGGFAAPLEPLPSMPDGRGLPPLRKAPESYDGSPLWDDFASRCVGCGACSACCPTCFCFGVREEPDLGGNGAERQRSWDNCLFRHHGEVAGGMNFRASRRDRLRYRFRHKYYGLGPHRGAMACVGCGRCRAVCPVDIDLTRILREAP
jgi:formate hydrogenlyase subunit 6/NADH:ubiquinone oxidoreductase subunit I